VSHGDAPGDHASDRAEIAALVAAYARHADRREFDALAALFVEGGVLAMHNGDPDHTEPSRVRDGRAEIAAAMELLRTYTVTHHMLGQHSVWFEVTDRARARGETYCLASHIRPGGPASGGREIVRMMAIRYFDDYVLDDATWRIERRRLAIDWIDEHPTG
jgi:hypothetical protein